MKALVTWDEAKERTGHHHSSGYCAVYSEDEAKATVAGLAVTSKKANALAAYLDGVVRSAERRMLRTVLLGGNWYNGSGDQAAVENAVDQLEQQLRQCERRSNRNGRWDAAVNDRERAAFVALLGKLQQTVRVEVAK